VPEDRSAAGGPLPGRVVGLPDGRRLALDDLGDREGHPVVYLHGTPDCRLARHPDDARAAAIGVRLVAVDRPGFGASTADAGGTLAQLGHDLSVALDELGIERATLLGWSAGGLSALAAATVLADRVDHVVLVGTVAPIEAAADDAVLAATGPARRSFVALAAGLLADGVPAAAIAEEVAPSLVPDPLDPAIALEHVLEGAGEVGRRELARVPGAAEQLAAALCAAVAAGRVGLVHDVTRQLEVGLDLADLAAPVRSIHGALDALSPPEVGAWLATRHPAVDVEVVPDAGHHVLLTRWDEVLTATVR
jgi:pimeloyl-ACP methyl ester carboxylesterase